MADGTRPDSVHVTYRRMHFDFEKTGFARHWHAGSPAISFFWDALSTAFPPGEKFFIDSARALRELTDDKELREEIAEFCRQEGHHTFQHIKFNRMVGEQGFDVAKYEGRFAAVLDRTRSKADPMDMLAITMALEHFTAGFAEQYLDNAQVTEGADPNVVALWAWHAAEEAEHKATCYDLYQRLGGGYVRRVSVMPWAWLLLLGITMRNLYDMLEEDGQRTNLRDLGRLGNYLLGRQGLVTRMAPSFLAYFRPSYHPWNTDDSGLIQRWLRSNARYIESSADKPDAKRGAAVSAA
ncbi:MAG TPA: metal-dependent hydrolase [Polyangiales bacterium]